MKGKTAGAGGLAVVTPLTQIRVKISLELYRKKSLIENRTILTLDKYSIFDATELFLSTEKYIVRKMEPCFPDFSFFCAIYLFFPTLHRYFTNLSSISSKQ